MSALLMSESRGRGADPVSVVMVTELKGTTWVCVRGGSGWVVGKRFFTGEWWTLEQAPQGTRCQGCLGSRSTWTVLSDRGFEFWMSCVKPGVGFDYCEIFCNSI